MLIVLYCDPKGKRLGFPLTFYFSVDTKYLHLSVRRGVLSESETQRSELVSQLSYLLDFQVQAIDGTFAIYEVKFGIHARLSSHHLHGGDVLPDIFRKNLFSG